MKDDAGVRSSPATPTVASIVLLGAIIGSTSAANAGATEPPAGRAAGGSEDPADAGSGGARLHPRRVFTLTVSPLLGLERIFELTGEYRIADKVGVAALAGIGQFKDDDRHLSATLYMAGAQVRWYVVGTFRHGMQVGGQLSYLHVASQDVLNSAEGTGIGPFAGYKIITDVGFTFDGQVGVQYLVSHVTSKTGVAPGPETDSNVVPLFRVNVGWSF